MSDNRNCNVHIMKHFIVILGMCLLAACSPQPAAPIIEPEPKPNPVVIEDQTIEELPSTLSIPHFGKMKLVGSNLTFDKVLEKNDVYTKHAISYLSNGLKITGVFLIPNAQKPHPLLIFNHGYIDPAIYTQGRGLKREEDYMAKQGFAVFHPDYRGHAGSDESPMTAKVYDGNLEYAMDSANAILAVREAKIPNVDASKVGMLGHSMGGGVTMAIMTARPELIDAAVLYAPVHARVWENFVRWRAEREEGDRTIAEFGTYDEKPDVWNALSPDTFLGDVTIPILLFQGTKDKDVPFAWADELNTRLTELKRDITYERYEDEGHEFSFMWTDFMKKTAAFFKAHLVSSELTAPLSVDRITKKSFGTYVTPEKSPVSPEKFTGFHTGVDFEAPEENDVSVRAACSGEIIYKQTVGGYGGVLIQKCDVAGEPVTALYGHIRLSSITKRVGDSLTAGEEFAKLGTGFSDETDGERPHLHFGLHKGSAVELKGYVASEAQLSRWLPPTFTE